MSAVLILVLPSLFLAMGAWACVAHVEVPLNTGSSAPVQLVDVVDVEVMDDGVLGIGSRGQDLVNHFLNEVEVAGGAVAEVHHSSSTLFTARFGGIETGDGGGGVLNGVGVWELSNTTIRISRSLQCNISNENINNSHGTEVSVGQVVHSYNRLYAASSATP